MGPLFCCVPDSHGLWVEVFQRADWSPLGRMVVAAVIGAGGDHVGRHLSTFR
jgi:hypothetical protein